MTTARRASDASGGGNQLQIDRLAAAGGTPLAMATLVSATGSTPKKAGAKMLLDSSGAISGTVTVGGCVDTRVLRAAAELLREPGTNPVLLDIGLGDEEAWELGLTCGGDVSIVVERVEDATRAVYERARGELAAGRHAVVVSGLGTTLGRALYSQEGRLLFGEAFAGEAIAREAARTVAAGVSRRVSGAELGIGDDAFFELLSPPRQLVIVGAGEVARSLVPIASELGMESVVIDARERFATRERFPRAAAVHVGSPSEIVASLPKSWRTAIVLVAHDYKFELPVLREVLRSDAGYIGMLGGKRRGETIRRMLREEGFTDEELGRIHSPIGLDIGARGTAEIALAIAAELVALERAPS